MSADYGNESAYQRAQHAIADLKSAVRGVVARGPLEGLTNAEIGRSLGIYMGHAGHEGHISRTLLALLEKEGVVSQDVETKRWRLCQSAHSVGDAEQ